MTDDQLKAMAERIDLLVQSQKAEVDLHKNTGDFLKLLDGRITRLEAIFAPDQPDPATNPLKEVRGDGMTPEHRS